MESPMRSAANPAAASTIRCFRGGSASAALEAARAALGNDACVVSTRLVQGPGGASAVELLVDTSPAPPVARTGLRTARPTRPALPITSADGSFRLAPPSELDGHRSVEDRLIAAGVFEAVARPIALGCRRVPGKTPAQALAELLDGLLAFGEAPWTRAPRRRVVTLVGPTGVGKTTTIAKIAARALLDSKLKVSLITLDTFRVGAIDHLRRYGEIMDVPTWAARDEATLAEALQRSSQADLVLVDTAGRSPAEAESFERQLALVRAAGGDVVLAAAAGTGLRQLRALRTRYSSVALSGLIVTKLDESDGAGAFLNTAALLGPPVVAWTDGQRVPEDVHVADAAWFKRGFVAEDAEEAR